MEIFNLITVHTSSNNCVSLYSNKSSKSLIFSLPSLESVSSSSNRGSVSDSNSSVYR